MLVLSRRTDEVIMIGDDIRITVCEVRGDTVRLGIDAPKNLPVHREEVYEAIKRDGLRPAKEGANNHDGAKTHPARDPGEFNFVAYA